MCLSSRCKIQRDPDQYDMLNLAHWEFWVVSGTVIRQQQ
jgi:hypothetical protein